MKNTSNPTASETPTRLEQESQSDNSPTVPSYGHGYYTKWKGKRKGARPHPPLTEGGVGVKRAKK